jgi:dipeptidyl aminopeptidase/acylaminoacyl peptidase
MLPDERHMPRDHAGRVYVEERMTEFFARALA